MYKKVESPDFVIKKSRNGCGVFTKKDFSASERLFEIHGVFLTCEEDEDLDEETRNNAYRFDKDLFISAPNTVADYVNHSCNPNARVEKIKNKLYMVSLYSIPKGGEVFFDYSTILANDDVWEMKCNCGEQNCRQIVKKFNLLPHKVQKKYISEKIVPQYILDI
ncbi:MAG: uncharacterized protein QG589_196 [Patescibacteria group bacterium]|nr:uncharacterized protein [Patescibacteria group bacterium]